MTKVSLPIEGGCHCGALRYEVSGPPLMIYCCHCTNCQKITGSAFVMSATIVEASFGFTKGESKKIEWKSDAGNDRYGHFCGDCGCRIAHGQTPSIGVLSLRAGTFDDTSWVWPGGHIWLRSAQPWFQPAESDTTCDVQPTDYSAFVEHFKAQNLFDA